MDVRLASCDELDWIVATTGGSVYELIVLSGETGDVMVRGGRFCPEFRRARVVGSLLGASAVKLRTVCVGQPLELQIDGRSFVTSHVKAVSHHRNPAVEGAIAIRPDI